MNKAKFHLEKRKDSNGKPITKNVPIRMSLIFNGNRLEYYTQQRVSDIKNFNKDCNKSKKPPINPQEPQAGRINRKLSDLKAKAELLYDNAIALGESPTPEYLRAKLDEQFKGKSLAPEQKPVKVAFEEFREFTKAKRANSTYKNIKSTECHFSNYVGKKYGKLTFDEVTRPFAYGFRDYLVSLGHLNNTVVKYSHVFNGFLSWCKDEDRNYFSGNVKIKGTENDTAVIFLTKKELDELALKPMPKPALERVRDVFIFSSHVGMRYGDIFKLKKSDIKDRYLTFFIEKNKKTIPQQVPISDQARAILNKYKDLAGDKALPVLSNQKMNEYIKDVMEHAGFDEIITIAEMQGNGMIEEKQYPKWQLIGCHTTRKSFITLAVASGTQEIVIKAITGHSKNSRAFGRYYTVPETVKEDAINNMFSRTGRLRRVM